MEHEYYNQSETGDGMSEKFHMSPDKWDQVEAMAATPGWSHLIAMLSEMDAKFESKIFAEPTSENQFTLHRAVGGSKVIRDIVTFVTSASSRGRQDTSEFCPPNAV